MVRAKDGSAAKARRSQVAAAAGLIALAGAGLTAVRVEAQRAPANGLQSDGAPAFAAPPADISFLGPLDLGMGVVRPAELVLPRSVSRRWSP